MLDCCPQLSTQLALQLVGVQHAPFTQTAAPEQAHM
jgi:hypothetical protein